MLKRKDRDFRAVAGAVVLVASDEAGWITGQSVLANGGNAFSI
jgi:NAD(P)-dependent dehydrogenase (short-subunit alcohol dehydrogenase family)